MSAVAVAGRRGGVLAGDGHFDLHARDEFEDGGYAALHLVHCCSLRVHVPWLAWSSRLPTVEMCAIHPGVSNSRGVAADFM